MCITVTKIRHSYKLETIDGEKLIPVWKVIAQNDKSAFAEFYSLNGAYATYHNWKHGWNSAYIHNYLRNTWWEKDLGFHFCLTRHDAEYYLKNVLVKIYDMNCRYLKVVKMFVRKHDIVSKGFSEANTSVVPSLVATEAYYPTQKS